MSLSTSDFWKLIVASRLLTPEQCQQLQAEFAQVKGASSASVQGLAKWLISRQALSRYQAAVLLAGRPGPFYYGDYRVYERIDQGPHSGQFRAVHVPSGHPVRLRFLAGSVLKDERQWAAVAACVQRQAGVVYTLLERYFEPVDLQAFRFVAAEDVRGETLDQLMAQHGRLPFAEAARVIRLVAFALSYMHQLGIVHGDIRPGQILYEPGGNVKLLIDPTQLPAPLNLAQTDPNSLEFAKADYLAPEFMQPNKLPDAATDIYALGCTFYQLLTGQPPFPGGLPAQKLQRHAMEPIQPLDPYGVPAPLAQLIAYMMAKNPAVRPQQATVVAEHLAPYIDPAKLQLPAQAPLPTLAAYENWIRQKQATLVSAEQYQAAAPGTPVIAVSEAAPAIGVAPVSPTSRLKKAKRGRKQLITMLVGTGVAAIALGAVAFFAVSGSGDDTTEVAQNDEPKAQLTNVSTDMPGTLVDDGKQPPPVTPPVAPPGASPMGETLVTKPDDGTLLWASPTSGSAITLNNVPPNAQVFLIARPAELLASPHGAKVLDALGPGFVAGRDAWEKAAGVKLSDVRQVVMALHDNGGQMPRPSYRVELNTPVPAVELLARWGSPAPQMTEGDQFFQGSGRAYYVPTNANDSVFVMGDPADIKELAIAKGMAPVLRREVDQLRRLTDNDRHFTVLLAPGYLYRDGRDLFSGPYEKLLGPMSWLLGDDMKATTASLHFDEPFYVELRLIGDLSRDKHKLAADIKDRLAQVPDHIENYILALNPPKYWEKLSLRYPGMIRFLHGYTRVGVEDDVAMVNAVAPGALAHNLFLGGELAVVSTPGASAGSSASSTAAVPTPKNLEELLKHPVTFEVPKNDLNLVMADLEKEVNADLPGLPFQFTIKIIGKDLEQDGITRNQQIVDFKMEKKPLFEVLNGLMIKGNGPAPSPDSPEQKLVWVVGPDPDKPDQQTVLITTRKASEAKKYNLRPPFVK
jgi:hypothetical protein